MIIKSLESVHSSKPLEKIPQTSVVLKMDGSAKKNKKTSKNGAEAESATEKMAGFNWRYFSVAVLLVMMITTVALIGEEHDDVKFRVTKLSPSQMKAIRGQVEKTLESLKQDRSFFLDQLDTEISLASKDPEKYKALFETLQKLQLIPVDLERPQPFSIPRFSSNENHKGPWFEPDEGWEKKCVNMPAYMDREATSVNLGGHCLLVCPGKHCTGSGYLTRKWCRKIQSLSSFHSNSNSNSNANMTDNFTKLSSDFSVRSFRKCQRMF